MTEPQDTAAAPKGPAKLDVRPVKRPLWQRLSLVWLVPVFALGISLWAAWQNYLDQGVLITISFENASGITADETEIKYRDVTVGKVEDVEFAEGLSVVLVHARVQQTVAPYLDDDAQFWVVRPDVSVRGITGLDTVLSGVYIEGNWDTEPDVAQLEFSGLERPVLTRAGQQGRSIVLRATDGGSVTAGAPVLHKGLQVGYLESPELSPDGTQVLVNAFVESPYDQRITSSTRFWDTSGFSVSFGTGGVSLDVNSLASLIEGGVAFDTIVSGGDPIQDGQLFDIFSSQQAARDSLFSDPNAELLKVAVLFEQSVSGLTQGSEVRFQGIRIGEVSELNAIVVGEGDTAEVRLQAVLEIAPGRLGMRADATVDDALTLLSDFVARGLRARMVTGNILSGSLVVELVQVDDALPAIVTSATGLYPVIPTTDSQISDVAATAEGVLARINALPVEELMDGAIDLMDSLERLANDDSLVEAPASLVALLDEARGFVASDDMQAVPRDLRQVINDLDAILASATAAGLVDSLDTALEAASAAAANIETGTEGLPELVAQIEALTAKANALAVEGLLDAANDTLRSIDTIVSDDATAQLPATLAALLEEARALVASEDLQAVPGDLRDVINDLDAIVTSAAEAELIADLDNTISAANQAVANIEAATANLPEITAQIEALTTKANGLAIEGLVETANDTLASIDTFIQDENTAALPASLNGALDEMRVVLEEIREGGAIENVNAALAAANDAAQAIEDSVSTLPALSARASQLVAQTSAVIDSYSERSRFSAETLATLREIQAAADAVSALARAIQRNPNSLLTGR
ncbi:MlaD family protein [Yoonia sp. SS1-5]|uniref:MlaD family protein n=1 Tax=Yoonia rhodophyticola TaxID=3137370 RepID=A0AAN0NKU4_9RHOB